MPQRRATSGDGSSTGPPDTRRPVTGSRKRSVRCLTIRPSRRG